MDDILCHELIQEIFRRLPPPSCAAVCLVSKRWLRIYRSSRTSLSLLLTPQNCAVPQLSTFLSHFRLLSSLSLINDGCTSNSCDHLLFSIADSCPNLRNLCLLTGPVSLIPLLSLSTACPRLISLSIILSRPLFFLWIVPYRNLKDLSIAFCASSGESDSSSQQSELMAGNFDIELKLESLHLSGIKKGDRGLDFLWRSCKNLKKLQLRCCESIGNDTAESSFSSCLKDLQEVEFRTCRTIIDGVLLKLAKNCTSLQSLLVYDGGSKDGLRQFISQNESNLQKVDLRLPLDLDNSHLLAMAEKFRGLSSLRLQSCCLVTGEGLKAIATAMDGGLEELALVNCDVVEKEPGLLTELGQNLIKLKKLDLSYNDLLVDRELISMLISCSFLSELKLRGCKRLSNLTMVSVCRSCRYLESVDIMQCCGIQANAIELFVSNSPRLRRLEVEEVKVSDVVRTRALNRLVEIVS